MIFSISHTFPCHWVHSEFIIGEMQGKLKGRVKEKGTRSRKSKVSQEWTGEESPKFKV
jgi:hypothetical protein